MLKNPRIFSSGLSQLQMLPGIIPLHTILEKAQRYNQNKNKDPLHITASVLSFNGMLKVAEIVFIL